MTANRVWVFDCDGVILDSNGMKSEGFAAILAEYDPAAVAPFLSHQKASFGTSRFRLIEQFFARFLKRAPAPGEDSALLEAFGTYCREAYPRQALTEGARAQLQALHDSGAQLYVASGSAQDELRAVFAEIGLAPLFAEIFGSPRPKIEILAEILERHPGAEICFLGDAKADFEAARHHGLPFVYVSGYTSDPDGMAALQAEHGFVETADLAGLDLQAWPPRNRSKETA